MYPTMQNRGHDGDSERFRRYSTNIERKNVLVKLQIECSCVEVSLNSVHRSCMKWLRVCLVASILCVCCVFICCSVGVIIYSVVDLHVSEVFRL